MDALVVGPGEGEIIRDVPVRSLRIKADREELTVVEMRYGPGERGPEPHVHRDHADAFWVLEGEIVIELGPGGEPTVLGGGFVLVPPGVVHTFRNAGTAEARYLNFHAPGSGFADHLRALRDGDREAAARFDQLPPPSGGGRPASEAVFRAPGEGEVAQLGPSGATFKAQGGHGGGFASLTELVFATGPGPVPHRHERMTDSFYVLEGELVLVLGDEEVRARPGTYALAPPGAVHTFRNDAEAPVRVLNLMAPAGLEQYLKEVAAGMRPGEPPDPRVMARIASRYDFHPAAEPASRRAAR